MDTPSHSAGTPIWVDAGVPDIDAAAAFYQALFGWDIEDMGPDAGNYRIARLDGKRVAGIGPQMNPGPPAWTTYVKTDDVKATAGKVTEAGGQVLMPPMDVMEEGRMAIFTDDAGAAFAVWEPKENNGAELFNVPGALSWNELNTRQPDQAKAFYASVFGWGEETHPMGPGRTYTEWQLDGRSIGGMMPIGPPMPEGMPNFWTVYFAVDDTDASLAKVTELGGSVVMAPMDIPAGRFAVVKDPTGTTFTIMKLAADSAAES